MRFILSLVKERKNPSSSSFLLNIDCIFFKVRILLSMALSISPLLKSYLIIKEYKLSLPLI